MFREFFIFVVSMLILCLAWAPIYFVFWMLEKLGIKKTIPKCFNIINLDEYRKKH